jgi:threonine/homoserine/homoserine lactone efflux protein
MYSDRRSANLEQAMTWEFLVTSLIVVVLPGTGVIYTVSTGLSQGGRASVLAATGCTAGIVPHLLASIFGLAALLHTSALAFQVLKIVGVLYLAYLAWAMWRESGEIELDSRTKGGSSQIVIRGFLINILNPKLSIFFLAFLPQFVPAESASAVSQLLWLSSVFMLMTFVVFVGYGLLADRVREFIRHSPAIIQGVQRAFAGLFVALAMKLAVSER